MKYEKCPICEEKLRNGVCPMCGYDFNRLGRSRILKDGHWDILTTDKKTSQPKYIHDEKRHPDFKNIKNTKTQSMKTQRKTSTLVMILAYLCIQDMCVYLVLLRMLCCIHRRSLSLLLILHGLQVR